MLCIIKMLKQVVKEALKQVSKAKTFDGNNDGTFFYEEFDFNKAKVLVMAEQI